MKYFVFRNTTIENLFGNNNFSYSGYDDILTFDADADVFVWFYLLPVESNGEVLITEIESYYNRLQLVYQKIPSNKIFLWHFFGEFSGILVFSSTTFCFEK